MRKIPTLFERDWEGDRSRVLPVVHPGCEWVLAGEGRPTRKFDGMCCAVIDGYLYKRREVKAGAQAPAGFTELAVDEETGDRVGWVPVGEKSEDRYFRWAWMLALDTEGETLEEEGGTYELVGPKVNGNPEGFSNHVLLRHGTITENIQFVDAEPLAAYTALATYFAQHDIEGIVWWHEDGRQAKIKARDFGLKRGARPSSSLSPSVWQVGGGAK